MQSLRKRDTIQVDEECLKAFVFLEEKLVLAPIIAAPEWELPLELMSDESDYPIGAVLGQEMHSMPYTLQARYSPMHN